MLFRFSEKRPTAPGRGTGFFVRALALLLTTAACVFPLRASATGSDTPPSAKETVGRSIGENTGGKKVGESGGGRAGESIGENADGNAQVALPTLSPGNISAQSAILIDADSGAVLYEKDASHRLPMASTTKIMTALCAVELADTAQVISVDPAAVGIEGSSIYLYEGEQLTLEQLLYALLLESANDAATAIAIAVAGSVEAFADRMNEKAAALGLKDTHFTNPHGLDNEEHYTTAHDLALIAQAALKNPVLRTIFSTRKTSIPLNGTGGVRLLLNHNKMLRMYEGAIGVKTGFTKRSGRCLVSAANRDGLTLIAVTLNAPDDWNDHTHMLDAGFAACDRVTLCREGEYRALLPVSGGKEDYVLVKTRAALALTLPKSRPDITCTVELPRFMTAPVEEGSAVGDLIFRCDIDGDGRAEVIGSLPLYTGYAVERKAPKSFWRRLLARLGLG